jgi:hypothetical protein
MIRAALSIFSLTLTLVGATSQAASVSYYECEAVAKSPTDAVSLTAYLGSGLVTISSKANSDVFSTTVQQTASSVIFSGEALKLVIDQTPGAPTMTFTARLTYAGVTEPFVCQLSSYEQPQEDGPGGVSVHN